MPNWPFDRSNEILFLDWLIALRPINIPLDAFDITDEYTLLNKLLFSKINFTYVSVKQDKQAGAERCQAHYKLS